MGGLDLSEYRIFGPPGTGKTTKLAAWARRAAEKFGSDAVIICSLTKAAAQEIASREVPVVKANVGTMHSLCYRILGKPEIAETKADQWNKEHPTMPLEIKVKGSKQDAFAETPGGAHGTQMYEEVGLARARMTPIDQWSGPMHRFHTAWTEWKENNALIDFTDMIDHVLAGDLRPDPGVRAAFFDEVQDFSALELALARMWGEQMEYVVLVGDPDQAIFEWRGASPRDFLEPEIPPEQIRILDQSYRIPNSVHTLATEWIERCSYRFPTEYKSRDEEGEVQWLQETCYRAPARLVDEIEACVDAEHPCMFLATCGYMLAPVIKELKARGVPFHNPYAQTNGGWNPLRARGRLGAFLVASTAAFGENHRMWTWDELWQWAEIVEAGTLFRRGAKKIIKAEAKDEFKQNLPPGADELEDLFQMEPWLDLCEALDAEKRGTDTAWLIAHTLSSKQKLIEYTSRVYVRHGAFTLHKDPLVIVGTVHSVKGAEAHTVFVAPDLSSRGYAQWSGAPEEKDSVIRVFYVAFTRARERLVLLGRSGQWAVRW